MPQAEQEAAWVDEVAGLVETEEQRRKRRRRGVWLQCCLLMQPAGCQRRLSTLQPVFSF